MPSYTGAGAFSAVGVNTLTWGQPIQVQGGDVYSVYARVRSVMSMKDPIFNVGLEFSNGTTIWAKQAQTVASTDWTELSGTITIPAGVTSAVLKIQNTEPLASFEVDEFKAGDVTLAQQMQAQVNAASGHANTASTKATEAGQSASAAAASATTASTKAGEASTSASQASTSKNDAAGSASAAASSATTAANARDAAAGSAGAASTSATNAAASATTAGQQATAATNAKTAAETARGGAETARSEAVTAKETAQGAATTATTQAGLATTAKNDAAGSATAAANSASTATTKAGEAGASATTASNAANTATTKAGEASTSASQAATSASNASGSATNAATSATTAATARLGAIAGASGNLLSKNDFEDGNAGQFNSTGSLSNPAVIVNIPAEYPHPLGRVKAIMQTTRDSYDGVDRPLNFTGIRTIRATGYVLNLSHVDARAGANVKRLDSSQNWPASTAGVANSGAWVAFSHEFQIDATGLKSWRPFFQLNGYPANGAMLAYWTDLRYEDITESKRATEQASAATTAATNAAASANEAGQQATAAASAKTAAETARGQAQTSATNAATSATNAAGSASTAATQATNAANSANLAGDKATAASGSASTATAKANEAAQSATAAAGSATTAGTKAGEASSSASQAATSANNASGSASTASTQATNAANSAARARDASNTAASLPSTFAGGTDNWTTNRGSSPTANNSVNGLSIGTDAVLGTVGVMTTGAAGSNILTRGVMPWGNGRVYRIRTKLRVTSSATEGTRRLNLIVVPLNEAYAAYDNVFTTVLNIDAPTNGDVIEVSQLVSNVSNTSVGVLAYTSINNLNPAYIRVGVRNDVAQPITVAIQSIEIVDVTSEIAALLSANAASSSASTADTKATEAAQSATAATTAKNAAETARSGAETAQTAATTAKNDAQTAAATATTQATNAANSATLAGDKATAASNSAATATTKASEASQSATAAASSATTATTKAGEASTSATQAASSASNAAGSATAASTSATTAANAHKAAEGAIINQSNHSIGGRISPALNFMGSSSAGSPEANPVLPASNYGSDEFGDYVARSLSVQWQGIFTRPVLAATPESVFRVTVKLRVLADMSLRITHRFLTNTFARNVDYSTNSRVYTAADGVVTMTCVFGRRSGGLVTDTYSSLEIWNSTPWFRWGVDMNQAGYSGEVRFYEFLVEDITAADLAARQAAAAATSATDAAASSNAAGQQAAAATAAKTAAETARSGAETAQTAAVTAKNTAESAASTATTQAGLASTSATQAGQSATAASNSASTATTKATEAAQSATGANTSAVTASTKAGEASSSASSAATSASNAAGSANTASTQANLAVVARKQAQEGAKGNLWPQGVFDNTLNRAGWTAGAVIVDPFNAGSYALTQGSQDINPVGGNITNAKGRTFRLTGKVYNPRANATGENAHIYVRRVKNDGSTDGQISVGMVGPKESTDWVTFDITYTCPTNNSTDTIYFFLQSNTGTDSNRASILWKDLLCEDTTESKAAQVSASAAASSATDASASATAALQSATAANSSKLAAETARSGAETAQSAAVTAKNDAQGAASTATTQAGLASNSAVAAGSSATAAANSASTASTKATEASQSATSASNSANTASTKAGEASTSASQAATSASNASGSANSANTSATTAATARDAARTALISSTEIIGIPNADTQLFSHSSTGFPASMTAHGGYGVDADGPYIERNVTTQWSGVFLRNLHEGGPDRVYRVTARVKLMTEATVRINIRMLDAQAQRISDTAPNQTITKTVDGVQTISAVMGRVAGGLVTDVITSSAWSTSVYFRFGVYQPVADKLGTMRLYELRVEDVTEADKAARQAADAASSATAASTSATQAAASATTAGQQATAASTSANTATTKAGEASTSASQAATSASDAAGSANAASTSATTAAQATNVASTHATGNMVNRANFEDGSKGSWGVGNVVDVPIPHPNGLAKTLRVTNRDCFDGRIFYGNFKGRTFRVKASIYNPGAWPVRIQFEATRADGSRTWPSGSGNGAVANGTDWVAYEDTLNVSVDTRQIRVMAISLNPTSGDAAQNLLHHYYITDIDVRDVTEAVGAAGSASAAATSATNAAASSNTAGQQATAATNAKTAAETARGAAETARGEAVSAKQDAQGAATTATTQAGLSATSASNAGASATAAQTAASTATTKASEAAQSATTASSAATTASTKAGEASNSASQAATSATNAAGSASAASTSASTAATARDQAQLAAQQNLVKTSTFENGSRGTWPTALTIVDAPADHPLGRTKAGRYTNRSVVEDNVIVGNFNGRTFRVSGYFYNASNVTANFGFRMTTAAGATSWLTPNQSFRIPAGGNAWVYLDAEFTVTLNTREAHPYLLAEGASTTGTNGTFIYVTDLKVHDVTESKAAAASASAASTSETNAAASANSASQQASAANSARTGAETARGAAEVARSEAVTAKNDAQGSATTATTQAGLAATSASSASNAASAAATSAATATTKATEASQSATSASSAANTATTKAGEASSSATQAASSAQSAAGSQTSASSSAQLAANAALAAGGVAGNRLNPQTNFQGDMFGFIQTNYGSPLAVEDVPVPHPLGRTKTGVITARHAYAHLGSGARVLRENLLGRTIRISGWCLVPEGYYSLTIGLEVVFAGRTAKSWINHSVPLQAGEWVNFSFDYVAHLPTTQWSVTFHQLPSTGGPWLSYLSDIEVVDVTEALKAAASASAAASSASSASASATEAGQAAAASNSAKMAAETALAGAQSAREGAVTAEQNAQGAQSTAAEKAALAAGSATAAGNAATAAASSATTATTKASEAAQSAATASSASVTAATKAGEASTSATQAAQSRTDAAGSANAAATNSTTAAQAASAAANFARANLVGKSDFEDGKAGTWRGTVEDVPLPHPLGRLKALKTRSVSNDNMEGSYDTPTYPSTGDYTKSRRWRMSGYVISDANTEVTVGFWSSLASEGYNYGSVLAQAKLTENTWERFELEITIPAAVDRHRIMPWIRSHSTSGPRTAYVTDLFWEDITESAAAQVSANAASTSATQAAASATAAGEQATAATSAKNLAETAAATAETARSEAATAKQDAQSAAATAVSEASNAANAANAAGDSASAAATSASTAVSKASEAAQSATIASTQAATAATKAGEASISATQAAQSHTDAAGSASTASSQAGLAASSATAAGDAATAASNSATTAGTKATEASQAAATATTQAQTATTKAGEAATSASSAASSASSASGSATAAATSATTSANANLKASEAATGNMLSKSNFQDNSRGDFTSSASAVATIPAEYPHPLTARTRALRQIGRDLYDGDDRLMTYASNRIIRISGYVLNLSNRGARVGFSRKSTTGAQAWPVVQVAPASQTGWIKFDLEWTLEVADVRSWRPFFKIDGNTSNGDTFDTYWTDLRFEDITDIKATQTSAAAASTSETNAAASATAAGQSASSASSAANTASTQAGLATSAASSAATSSSSAAGAASSASASAVSASNSVSLAALALGAGLLKNPAFVNTNSAKTSPSSTSWNLNSIGTIGIVGGKYGNAVDVQVTATTADAYLQWYYDKSDFISPFNVSPDKVLVTLELEPYEGSTNGYTVAASWISDTTWRTSVKVLKDVIQVNKGIQLYQVVLERPTGVGTNAVTNFNLRLNLNANGNGATRALSKVRVHRIDMQEIKADSYLDQQLQTKATVDGLASSAYVLRVKSGGASAGFEMVAASSPNGAASSIRMSADEIIMDGTLKAAKIGAGEITVAKLAVGDMSNMLPDWNKGKIVDWNVTNQVSFSQDLTIGNASGWKHVGIGRDTAQSAYFDVSAGETYFSSVWVHTEELEYNPRIMIHFQKTDGTSQYTMVADTALKNEWVHLKANVTVPAGAYRMRVLLHVPRPSGTTGLPTSWTKPVMRRSSNGEMIVNGSITATHMVTTENIITTAAQIKDAIITEAKITGTLDAAKIRAGTAMAGSIVVDGSTLTNIAAQAASGGGDPAAKINAGVTLIDPGKVVISGSTTLANWRGQTDTTSINGGAIETGSITANRLDAASMGVAGLSTFGGLLKSSNYAANSAGWMISQSGAAEFNSLQVRRNMIVAGAVSTTFTHSTADFTRDNGDGWYSEIGTNGAGVADQFAPEIYGGPYGWTITNPIVTYFSCGLGKRSWTDYFQIALTIQVATFDNPEGWVSLYGGNSEWNTAYLGTTSNEGQSASSASVIMMNSVANVPFRKISRIRAVIWKNGGGGGVIYKPRWLIQQVGR